MDPSDITRKVTALGFIWASRTAEVAAKTRSAVLRSEDRSYTLEPASRYRPTSWVGARAGRQKVQLSGQSTACSRL